MNYFEALQMVKASFLDGSEKSIVIRKIIDHFKDKEVTLLDVGIGDGRYSAKIVQELSAANMKCSVLGVDPLPAAVRSVNKYFPEFRVVAQRFEDFETDDKFDVVLATHSLYYVSNPADCIKKMIDLTKPGGLTILVLWSDSCTLYRVYIQYKESCKISGANGFLTLEKAKTYLSSLQPAKSINTLLFSGRLVLSHWKSMPGALESAAMIFSREASLCVSHKIQKEHTDSLLQVISRFGEVEPRVNGVIFLDS